MLHLLRRRRLRNAAPLQAQVMSGMRPEPKKISHIQGLQPAVLPKSLLPVTRSTLGPEVLAPCRLTIASSAPSAEQLPRVMTPVTGKCVTGSVLPQQRQSAAQLSGAAGPQFS